MAKTASELARESVLTATEAFRRVKESPLEQALREARIGGSAGGAIETARANEQNVTKVIGTARDEVLRHASPYRDELNQIGALSRRYRFHHVHVPTTPTMADDTITSVGQIGERVRQARHSMKMTQQQFADFSGVGRRFIVELEKGKPSLQIDRVLAVCSAAGIKVRFG